MTKQRGLANQSPNEIKQNHKNNLKKKRQQKEEKVNKTGKTNRKQIAW